MGLTSGYIPQYVFLVTDTLADGVMVRDNYRSYDALFTTLENELFVTVQHKFGGFTVKPGIRLCHELLMGHYADFAQYDFSKPFFSVRPSLHLSYRTESMHNFNMSYTRRIAAPEAQQLSLFPLYGEDSYNTGNPDLDRVYTNYLEAGWTKYWNTFGSVGLSAFYRGKTDDVHNVQLSVYHPLYGHVVSTSFTSSFLELETCMFISPDAPNCRGVPVRGSMKRTFSGVPHLIPIWTVLLMK